MAVRVPYIWRFSYSNKHTYGGAFLPLYVTAPTLIFPLRVHWKRLPLGAQLDFDIFIFTVLSIKAS